MLKKIIYLIVSGGLLLSGCSLDYEPLNGPSSGSFPASEEEAMAGLYAAYKGLANMTVKETPFPMRINAPENISISVGRWASRSCNVEYLASGKTPLFLAAGASAS